MIRHLPSAVAPVQSFVRFSSSLRAKRTLAGFPALAAACLALTTAAVAQGGATRLVSAPSTTVQGNGHAGLPLVSADGNLACFLSAASNLVAPDTGGYQDVFLRDLAAGVLTRESVSTSGVAAAGNCFEHDLSGDGNCVVFLTAAANLVPGYAPLGLDLFVRDRTTGTTTVESYGLGGATSTHGVVAQDLVGPSISHDGRYVAFTSFSTNLIAGDSNGVADVFVRDRANGAITRTPALPAGTEPNGGSTDVDISADGRWVVFTSRASNLVAGDGNGVADVFAWDRSNGTVRLVSAAASGTPVSAASDQGVISADGLWIAFTSAATDLVPTFATGVRQVYVKSLATNAVTPVSYALSGGAPDSFSEWSSISADGRYVAFESEGNDVTDFDYDDFVRDVYLHDRVLGSMQRISVSSSLNEVYDACVRPSISADGGVIAFSSVSDRLVLGDTNGMSDAFVHLRGVNESRIECAGNGAAAPCPCGNYGIQNRGCGNSVASNGTSLFAIGVPRVSADTVQLRAFATTYSTQILFVQSDASVAGGAGATFGDGLRCVQGTVRRLRTRPSGGGVLNEPGSGASLGATPAERISVLGGVPAGSTRWYQAFYRDSASFCTADTWNATNSFRIEWLP